MMNTVVVTASQVEKQENYEDFLQSNQKAQCVDVQHVSL